MSVILGVRDTIRNYDQDRLTAGGGGILRCEEDGLKAEPELSNLSRQLV